MTAAIVISCILSYIVAGASFYMALYPDLYYRAIAERERSDKVRGFTRCDFTAMNEEHSKEEAVMMSAFFGAIWPLLPILYIGRGIRVVTSKYMEIEK